LRIFCTRYSRGDSPHIRRNGSAKTSGEAQEIARITQHSVAALGLEPGQTISAILKSVAVAPKHVGRGRSL
jgi:hypothetical protein